MQAQRSTAAPAVPTGLKETFRNPVQIGVVVRDLDRTMKRLTDIFGIGPFRVIECPPAGREDRQFYRGAPARFRTRQAFADLGSIELELIQPVEGKSLWSDFLAEHGEGLHHVRFNIPELEQATARLKAMGIGVTQEGAGIRDGTYWANFDTEREIGFVIEAMKPQPGTDGRTPGIGMGSESQQGDKR